MVDFDGPDDPLFPHNWPLWKKIIICGAVGLSALSVSMGSAMFSESAEQLMMEYKIGWVVATLGTSLFVFGFASGPVIWGPLSELYGRKTVLIPSCFGYICFCFMVGAAKDIQTIMICRFFAGFVGAAPLVAAPAAMADMFSATTRGNAMTNFAMVLFGGPMLAPICGGFTVKNSHLRWRFTSYFAGMVGVLALIAIVFFMDETHHGLILSRKAEILRRRTGNWGIHAAHDQVSLSIKEIVEKNISRPIVMLFTEPILFLITLYNAFIYGLLYLFLTAIPLIFVGGYHFSSGVGELPYLAMLIGEVIGGILSIFMERRYVRAVVANNGKPVPEERLPPMIVGSILFAIGIFWLGWTGNYASKVHWIVPTIGTAPIGMGLILIFLPCLNYIIDCYLFFAASALAGNTFLRSAFGAVFPLFAKQMFTNMKIKWATTLLGLISVVLIPVPVLFYKFGKRLRSKSKFAFDLD
ncbi:hypothetical protein CLUG_05825 [Clavispora lusitaniae ATCC 42720]|uniref:Major facilitator superfamily (MFS) profile domain-containing protein n=2 Tax=Clavispora lusitaniae TaxID=36911 RepID=C4YCI6_CLAL4|nr:uncharacterized protein CLUG_05825 [Clavispora lusitaniae ATCC 42720]EEQ41697.1 hypothetical protein CLUG_05825 [Clavispora lusitaniae ATCC 42720]